MVLAYHEITPRRSPYLYSVTCDELAGHLKMLQGLEPAFQSSDERPKVTFDDGHISHYTHALPLLEQFGVRGTFYVTAGWTGAETDYMNVAQLRELVSLGHHVEAHGWSHKMLTLCTPSELYQELRHSKEVLEDRLGVPVEQIALPHGRWNDRVLEACANAGYKDVYASEPRIAPIDRSGVRLTGRLMVTHRMSTRLIQSFLKADWKSAGVFNARDSLKRALKAVVGEKLYHRLWLFAASDDHRAITLTEPDRPTRILHLISSEGYYGAESMLVNLASSLNAINCTTILGVFRNSQSPHVEVAERAQRNGLQVEIIPCSGRIDRSAIRHIREIIFRNGVDVVHTHGFKANLYGALAGSPTGVPLVATYHLDWPDRGVSLYAYHLLDRLILRRFRKVIAVSDAIERSLRRAGLSRKRLSTIPNGIDMKPFWRTPANFGAAADQAPTIIGLVGRLTPQKGHRYLLEAAPAILARFPKTMFWFFGDGAQREVLEAQVKSLGLEKNVVFAGSRADMPAVYASVDIVVLPSINEGMPMTLIEALAAARPVVASRVGDVEKLIIHGETGLLVEAADVKGLESALLRLLANPGERFQLGSNGQRWVGDNFSADRMAARYREVYTQTFESQGA